MTIDIRLLIADDDDDCRYLLEEVFAKTYAVRAAADGGSALELARTWRPHVAIVDVCLPGVAGVQLARQLRSMGVSRVVAFSGSTELSRDDLMAFDEFLLKPLRPRHVRAALERIVDELSS